MGNTISTLFFTLDLSGILFIGRRNSLNRTSSLCNTGACNALVDEAEIARRKGEGLPEVPASHTPCEEIFREKTGQMGEGAVLEMAVKYRGISAKTPRRRRVQRRVLRSALISRSS